MRIHRIDVDGFGPLSGSFRFPEEGLALWTTPNAGGKSALAAAVSAALYGRPPDSPPDLPARIVLHVRRDDGAALVIARDLEAGIVQVTDEAGHDLTHRDGDVEVGEEILGLTRPEFEEAAILGFEDLPRTVANCVLLSLLSRCRGRGVPGLETPQPEELHPEAAEPETVDDTNDLQIIRSAAQELEYLQTGRISSPSPDTAAPAAGTEHIEPDADTEHIEPAGPTPYEDPDAPGLSPQERVARLESSIRAFGQRMAAKESELVSHSGRVHELQLESERLSMLTGAEPGDVEKLGSLLERMRILQADKEELRIDESKFRRRIEKGGESVRRLEELHSLFERLGRGDREFLDGFRQADTIRRGTRVLTRSEQRLDDTKLEEIRRARRRRSLTALLPLTVSTLGLFGSVAAHFTPILPLDPQGLVAIGLGSAVLAWFLLWRARDLRDKELHGLESAQERKASQMEELEKEHRYATSRLAVLAEEHGVADPEQLLDMYDEWSARLADLEQLREFAARFEEIDRASAALRRELGSFTMSRDARGDPTDVSLGDLETMHREYVRFFEIREDLDRAIGKTTRLENELASLESERARYREQLEILRGETGAEPGADRVGEPGADPAAEPGADREPPGGAASWTPVVSARMEAILRRFLPEVREVEVDAQLSPSLRLPESEERLAMEELAGRLSAASLDQVYLALRLAIMETLSSSGEEIPVFLDDPLIRADDARHDRALEFLVEDASTRTQVVLLTAQEVRLRWFLHQFPHHRDRITSIADPPPELSPAASSPSPSSSSS